MNRRVLYLGGAAVVTALAGALANRQSDQELTPVLLEERTDRNPISGQETNVELFDYTGDSVADRRVTTRQTERGPEKETME